jgi:hypothetical protein
VLLTVTQIVVFGLTENGRLYANERLLASSVTSFSVTNAHLIFTTSQHVIKFVHLTSGVHGMLPMRFAVNLALLIINRSRGSLR